MKEIFIDGKTELDILNAIQTAKNTIKEFGPQVPKYCMVTGDAMLVIAKNTPLEKEVIINLWGIPLTLSSSLRSLIKYLASMIKI